MYQLNRQLVEGNFIGRVLPPEIRCWLLRDQPPPKPTVGPGVAVVLLRTKKEWPRFRSGFGIPFQWRTDAAADEGTMPGELRHIADQCRRTAGTAAAGFCLSLSEPDRWRGRVSMTDFPATWDSAFAPLLASLLLAIDGLSANPGSALITGAARDFDGKTYLGQVEGVHEKQSFADLVDTSLYVAIPPGDAKELGVSPSLILSVTEEATQALRPAMIELAGQPPLDAEPDSVVAYHRQLALARDARAARFFCERILPILGDLGADFASARPHLPNIATLVTTASNAHELPALTHTALHTLGVEINSLVLIHDRPGKHLAEAVQTLLPSSLRITLLEIGEAHDVDGVFRDIGRGLPRDDRCLIFDLTPGFKPIALAMTRLARPGDALIYMQHKLEGGVVDPRSYRLWAQRIASPPEYATNGNID